MWNIRNVRAILLFIPLILLASCGSGNSSSSSGNQSAQPTAGVFTVGTDAAPTIPSIISFQVMLNSVTLTDQAGNQTSNLLSNPGETIDFVQWQGLNDLIDLNNVPANDTYVTANISISSPTVGFIDTSVSPPVMSTTPANLTQQSVSVALAQPLTLNANDLVGLFMDFDLRQSLSIDSQGNVTVDPVFDVRAREADDASATIDCFVAGVVSVSGSSFTIQGPHGRIWTVDTSSSTDFDSGEQPSSYTTNTVVEVSGTLNSVTRDIDASEVEVLSQDHFYAGGLLTYVNPAAGQGQDASQIQQYTRTEVPDGAGIVLGQINSFSLDGSERYMIADIHSPFTSLLFNPQSLLPGQRVGLGGKISTSNGATTLTVHRVVLRRQGQEGSWVAGSTMVQNGNAGTFQMDDNFTAGVLLPTPLTVVTTNWTRFVNLNGLSSLTGSQAIPLRIVGFVLLDPETSQPVMLARSVEELTD